MSMKKASTATATKFQCFDWISLRAVERAQPNLEKPVANAQFKVISSLLVVFFLFCSRLYCVGWWDSLSVPWHSLQFFVLILQIRLVIIDIVIDVSLLKRVKRLQWRGSLSKWPVRVWNVYSSDGWHLWFKCITIWCHIGHCVILLRIKYKTTTSMAWPLYPMQFELTKR